MKKILLSCLLLTSICRAQTGCNATAFSPLAICYPNQILNVGGNVLTNLVYLCGPNSVVWDTASPSLLKIRQIFVKAGSVYNFKGSLLTNQVTLYAKAGSTVNIEPGTNIGLLFTINKEVGAVVNNYSSGTIITNVCVMINGPSINCLSTNVNEVGSINAQFWPNPSTGKVNLTTEIANGSEISVRVSNQMGETLYTEKYLQEGSRQLSLENLSAGLYFVDIRSENVAETRKLLLVK